MSVIAEFSESDSILTIKIVDKFDFSALNAFRAAYNDKRAEGSVITVDLKETSMMDSSALSMLLQMFWSNGTGHFDKG
ncbi:MAG: anti-sigma factor antagonist [Methylococcales bacterium]|jgi:HptB-dependent secretion and biofilm anti anti-sigma factor|nr:anti-sigma factor antagonist [Methylococcales bacterium]MBT7445029.1 anti-sigma factor antagonist [Methylococcales bacterium]